MDNLQKEAIAHQNYNPSDWESVSLWCQQEKTCVAAANTLQQQSEQLSKKVVEWLSVKFPLVEEDPSYSGKVVEEIQFYISLISYGLISRDSGLIDRHLISKFKEDSQAFSLSPDSSIAALNYIKENHGLIDEAASVTNEYIDEAIAALSQLTKIKVHTAPEETIDQPSKLETQNHREILTLEEIQKRYPRQWVLIVEPEMDEDLNVIRGKVLYNSPDRDEAYSKLSLRNGKLLAIEYTGPVSDDLAVML